MVLPAFAIAKILNEGPHGRNKTKYYGRVARNLFISSTHASSEKYESQFKEFSKLAEILDIKLPEDFIEKSKKLNNLKESYYKILGKWLVGHENVIIKEKLDMAKLYEFLKNINSINPKYNNLFGDIYKIMEENIEEL